MGGLSLPLYFSFFGSEAAARFSLLLCIHSVLLAAVPKILVSNVKHIRFQVNLKLSLKLSLSFKLIFENHKDKLA